MSEIHVWLDFFVYSIQKSMKTLTLILFIDLDAYDGNQSHYMSCVLFLFWMFNSKINIWGYITVWKADSKYFFYTYNIYDWSDRVDIIHTKGG